jgi:hypothetical protein
VGKPEGKRLCGRPRHRWKDYVNIDLKETGWEYVKLIFFNFLLTSIFHYRIAILHAKNFLLQPLVTPINTDTSGSG